MKKLRHCHPMYMSSAANPLGQLTGNVPVWALPWTRWDSWQGMFPYVIDALTPLNIALISTLHRLLLLYKMY